MHLSVDIDLHTNDNRRARALLDYLRDHVDVDFVNVMAASVVDQETGLPTEVNLFEDPSEGLIDFDARREEWVLICAAGENSASGCGEIARAEGTAVAHDALVQVWVDHARDHHNGDGSVPRHMLID